MPELKYRCMTKATNKESGSPRRSKNWATSRRATFKIYDEYVTCGDWSIPFNEITNAIAYKTKSMFLPVTVLQLETSNETYQFGFNPWATPLSYLPLDIKEEKVKLKYLILPQKSGQ